MGEALDSLFSDGSGELYRQNLISSLRQSRKNDGHNFYTKGDLSTKWDLKGYGDLSVEASGYYGAAASRDLLESAAFDLSSRRHRFTDHDSRNYDYSGDVSYDVFYNYCCPVKLKMSCKSSPKPSKHRHRGLFFEKQAPLIIKRRFWWRFRVPFIRDFYPFFFRISHKCNEVDIIHECQTHHGDNLRECAAALDAT